MGKDQEHHSAKLLWPKTLLIPHLTEKHMEVQIRGIHNCYVPTPAFVEIQGEGQDYNCYAPTPEFREKQGMQGLAIVMRPKISSRSHFCLFTVLFPSKNRNTMSGA